LPCHSSKKPLHTSDNHPALPTKNPEYPQKDATCYVERLIVDPPYRRRGIGTALLREIEAAHPAARRFELFTGHRSVNNLRLYERLGYRPFRQEVVNDRLTMVFLEKPIRG